MTPVTINRKHLVFVFVLTEIIKAKLSPNAEVHSVSVGSDSQSAFEATVAIAFGPTHKLEFIFKGAIDERTKSLGDKWSLTFQQEGINASVEISGNPDSTGATRESEQWKKMRVDIGLPEFQQPVE